MLRSLPFLKRLSSNLRVALFTPPQFALLRPVVLMGKIASAGRDLGTEKEDVCYLATILMGVGETLAAIDEDLGDGPQSKKPKLP